MTFHVDFELKIEWIAIAAKKFSIFDFEFIIIANLIILIIALS